MNAILEFQKLTILVQRILVGTISIMCSCSKVDISLETKLIKYEINMLSILNLLCSLLSNSVLFEIQNSDFK